MNIIYIKRYIYMYTYIYELLSFGSTTNELSIQRTEHYVMSTFYWIYKMPGEMGNGELNFPFNCFI